MKIFYRILFSICSLIVLFAVSYIVYGRNSDWYFANEIFGSMFLMVVVISSPVAAIGTLFGTLKEGFTARKKVLVIVITVVASMILVVMILAPALESDADVWSDYRTAYVKKSEPEVTVVQQLISEDGFFTEARSRFMLIDKTGFIFHHKKVISLEEIRSDDWQAIP